MHIGNFRFQIEILYHSSCSIVKSQRNIALRHALLGENIEKKQYKTQELTPVIRSALMLKKAHDSLKITDYRKAFTYASTQKILGYFHLYLLFFPGSIHNLLLKGRPTYLPSNFLRLPVFQKNIPAYHLRFLGPVRVYRNEAPVRTHILPKETAFLIYLALSKNKRIPIESLYDNFWQKSKNQARNLSHLLVRIRKVLKLPTAHLYIRRGFLHFRAPLTTDYQHYKEILIQAKVLERAGEWGFAVKEYLRAFKLFRGEPFKKMYDNQSENMRRVILNKLEREAINFAKTCLEHKNHPPKSATLYGGMADAKSLGHAKGILEKISKIIPYSEEMKDMVNRFK
ncbi:hypothetical protein KAX97_13810 [candidate division WOR-3 bacterium]|nr:hypothetical protein [candidate division WOR-3 bacterium]